jgi:hypothetical protein
VYRVYNQLNAATMSLQDRIRDASSGAQFCFAGCFSSASSQQAWRSAREAATCSPAAADEEIERDISRMEQKIREEDEVDPPGSWVCAILPAYMPFSGKAPPAGPGTCETPEAIALMQMPNGFEWVDGHVARTLVPWASWDIDNIHGRKYRPVYCKISLGLRINGTLTIRCEPNRFFRQYRVILQGALGRDSVNVTYLGNTSDRDIALKATEIPLQNDPSRTLADVTDNPTRKALMLQEVFYSRDWHGSIVIAPVYASSCDPHPPTWTQDDED